MHGWRSPIGNAGGGVQVALEAFGSQTPEELADRVGISRTRDLERRRLSSMVELGAVEESGGTYSLPGDHRERSESLWNEPYATVRRRRVRTHTDEGRTVTEVEETVTVASEAERCETRRRKHAEDREKFRKRRRMFGPEADGECRELLNRMDDEREGRAGEAEPDGEIFELEPVGDQGPPDGGEIIKNQAEVFALARAFFGEEAA